MLQIGLMVWLWQPSSHRKRKSEPGLGGDCAEQNLQDRASGVLKLGPAFEQKLLRRLSAKLQIFKFLTLSYGRNASGLSLMEPLSDVQIGCRPSYFNINYYYNN